MAFFLIASDVYDLKNSQKIKPSENKKNFFHPSYRPLVTVIVPAHNEQKTLLNNLLSIANNTYKNVQLIIVNDSSTDRTRQIALNFQRRYKNQFKGLKVLNINVRGKARAMNAGLKYAQGSLFMCLDADSFLTPSVLAEAIHFFRQKLLGALTSNVKIIPGKGFLNLSQRIEYAICCQMKKGEAVTRTQYIVGGIGSMYRTRFLRKLNFYSTDTITEDIDLSMKMIEQYGQKQLISFNPSMVIYTEAVTNISDLIKQRFRWKYGRYQVFLKRHNLFWSTDPKQNPFFSWFYLPYAIFSEFSFLIEPLVLALIVYLIITFKDFSMIIGAFATFCLYVVIQVSGATQSYSRKERIKLIAWAPLAYIFMYVLSFVEYVATIRGLMSARKLLREYRTGTNTCAWTHVARSSST